MALLNAHRRLYKHQSTFRLLFVHDLIYNREIGDNMATNNNNTNNNIITNNNNVIKDCIEPIQSTNDISSTSFDEEKRSGNITTKNECALPANWDWIKVDLFDTGTILKAHHKASLTICKQGKLNRFKSLNNSPWSHFKRGFKPPISQDKHYQVVRDLRDDLIVEGFTPKVSKCYESGYQGGKKSTIFGLSTIIVEQPNDGQYAVAVIAEEKVIWVALNGLGQFSKKQKQAKIVATGRTIKEIKPYGKRLKDVL